MPETLQAVVPCRIDFLDGVSNLVQTLCAGLDETEMQQIVTALGEAFSNVVRHSGLGPRDPVEVRARRWPEQLELQLLDGGASYQQALARAAGATESPELSDGGMGLYIIHQFMDRVTLHRDDRNRLSMVRNLGPPRDEEDD